MEICEQLTELLKESYDTLAIDEPGRNFLTFTREKSERGSRIRSLYRLFYLVTLSKRIG